MFRKNNERTDELTGSQKPEIKITTPEPNTAEKTEIIKEDDQPAITSVNPSSIIAVDKKSKVKNNKAFATSAMMKGRLIAMNNEIPGGKSFDQPIDDLSLITADQHYMTMVNSNGRLVKIPTQFASLVPHLQNKPVSEDFYEVMFGEGAYWKETLNEWRKKVASVPVSSGDAFTSFVELLKTIQDK